MLRYAFIMTLFASGAAAAADSAQKDYVLVLRRSPIPEIVEMSSMKTCLDWRRALIQQNGEAPDDVSCLSKSAYRKAAAGSEDSESSR